MNLIFLGLPGAGKGTQAKKLEEDLSIPHIATGDIFRKAIKEKTLLGEKAKSYIDAGELVPDEVTIGIVKERLNEEDCKKGFILDGFPRTINQAESLDDILDDLSREVDMVIYLKAKISKLVERLSGRRVCPNCGATYHIHNNPPQKEGICDKCGTELIQRSDDKEETVRRRIEINEEKMLKNTDMDDLSMESLEENLKSNSVYARVTPKNKLNIITALKNMNEIVAMTGDGVNDAPALKKADIGVAMGKRGTSVAKEASDMILLDDQFSTIVEAVRQGRVIFDNIQKFIHYLLSCNLSEILLIFLSIVIGVPVPLIALQILWLNVVTGVFPALAMAWEIPEDGVMSKDPRHPKAPIITNRYKFLISFQGLIIATGPLISYTLSLNNGIEIHSARTIGFMTLAVVHLLQVFNVRRKNGLGYDKTFFQNPYLIVAMALTLALQIFAIYTPIMHRILETTSLSYDMWLYVLLGAMIPNIVLQVIAFIKKQRK